MFATNLERLFRAVGMDRGFCAFAARDGQHRIVCYLAKRRSRRPYAPQVLVFAKVLETIVDARSIVTFSILEDQPVFDFMSIWTLGSLRYVCRYLGDLSNDGQPLR